MAVKEQEWRETGAETTLRLDALLVQKTCTGPHRQTPEGMGIAPFMSILRRQYPQ